MQEILEDVHESLATPDKSPSKSLTSTSQHIARQVNHEASSSRNAASTFDSIAALTEIMDSSNSSIPGGGSSCKDPDADTSSTKTEVEEMELDQFSDLEDNIRAHENVN